MQGFFCNDKISSISSLSSRLPSRDSSFIVAWGRATQRCLSPRPSLDGTFKAIFRWNLDVGHSSIKPLIPVSINRGSRWHPTVVTAATADFTTAVHCDAWFDAGDLRPIPCPDVHPPAYQERAPVLPNHMVRSQEAM